MTNISPPLPKLSIITVVFNGAATIQRAIHSVLSQSFQDFEYIIIDGKSTDGTIDIIKKINSEKIFWISEPDKGIYDAMNKGIHIAKGEWIYFLGSDDCLNNNEVLYKTFQFNLNEIDIVYGNVYSSKLKRIFDGPTNKEKLLFHNLCHQAIFYKRKIHEVYGYYNLTFMLFSDWEFNLRCFLDEGIKTLYIELVIAVYAEGGLSTVHSDIPFLRYHLLPINLQYLNKMGVKKLINIKYYDRWWRLMRSLSLGKNEDISSIYNAESIPAAILIMNKFQKKIPYSLLKNGIFSKSYMFLSYLFNALTNNFNK